MITFIKSKNSYSVFNDLGRVTMTAAMRDASFNVEQPDDEQCDHHQPVQGRFRHWDGRNSPGVDVPYTFDGAVNFTVAPGWRRLASRSRSCVPGEAAKRR